MKGKTKNRTGFLDSIVITGIGIAAIYWILESFMFFFLSPEANIVHHLLGEDMFETLTRVLVLCMFLIFGSHIQYNVNRRREADRAMKQQDEKYRTIIENIEEGFLETDLAGNFTFFNNSICKILGYSSEELMGMNTREYTNSENSKRLNEITDEVRRTGKPAQIKDFEKNLELNLGVSYTDLGRFRINIYLQRGEVSMVIRYIRADIPSIDDLRIVGVMNLNSFLVTFRLLKPIIFGLRLSEEASLFNTIDNASVRAKVAMARSRNSMPSRSSREPKVNL